MTESISAFAAWLGMAVFVLSDGRRGLATGLAVTTAALAVLAWVSAGAVESAAILAGGGVAAARRWRTGPAGWNAMPAGSTPRLVLCIAVGLMSLWIAVSVMQGAGSELRFAVLTVVGLAVGRLLAADEVAASTTGVAALVLGAAAGAAIHPAAPGPLPYLVGGLVAGASAWLPRTVADAR